MVKAFSYGSGSAEIPRLLEIEGVDYLVRPPKGYDETNSAITYLKMKSFIASVPLTNAALTDKKILKIIESTFKQLKPMLDFLNAAIE